MFNKIKELEVVGSGLYKVYFCPNWIQRLFKVTPKPRTYKNVLDGRYVYYDYWGTMFKGGYLYRDEKGRSLKDGSKVQEYIDKYRRSVKRFPYKQ